jgi:hypothetical protein
MVSLNEVENIIDAASKKSCELDPIPSAILDFEEYTSFRPLSNLKFVSKIIEKAAACQLNEYLTDNDLEVPLQSAYRRFHSTETALLKVQNDILRACNCVVLLMLDMSAAFDTVDHDQLLERMSKRYGIRGQVLLVSVISPRPKAVRHD